MNQNGNTTIPLISQHQMATFKCPECGESIFAPQQCVQFRYDRLKPDTMMMNPVMLMKCLGCKGYLVRGKDGHKIVKTPMNCEEENG